MFDGLLGNGRLPEAKSQKLKFKKLCSLSAKSFVSIAGIEGYSRRLIFAMTAAASLDFLLPLEPFSLDRGYCGEQNVTRVIGSKGDRL